MVIDLEQDRYRELRESVMNRLIASFLASATFLSACGGNIQSPDFTPTLSGLSITFTPTAGTTSAPVTVPTPGAITTPGSTFKFDAVGLFSTPPGTVADAQTVPCVAGNPTGALCTRGLISGVTWSVDAASSAQNTVASVDANGLATGIRRGTATVRARLQGFETAQTLVVDGSVLTSFVISASPGNSVPTGRNITLTATPMCEDEDGATPCLRTDYSYRWSLTSTFPADTVEFTPDPPVGRSIVIRTKRFGPFTIEASAVNEEGTTVQAISPTLNATARVLDDIIVMADPVQPEPVSVVLRTQTRFIARGVFSDGVTDVIRVGDLGGTDRALVWSADPSSVGQITIQNSDSPNTAILVTGTAIGTTGLTATGTNVENPALQLDDRASVLVRNLGLIAVTSVCPVVPPLISGGNDCPVNVQIPNGTEITFKARGTFEGDTPGVQRDLDPVQVPLLWSKAAGTGDVAVVDAALGVYRGVSQGTVTLTATLADPIFEPQVSDRAQSAPAIVVDELCFDQLLEANSTIASSEADATAPSGVANTGNVIDTDPATAGTFTVGASLLEGSLSMIFQRVATTITPPLAGQPIGFLLQYDEATFDAEDLAELQTLNAAGQVVQTLNLAVSDVDRGGVNFKLASTIATQPFSGLRLNVVVPSVLAITPIAGGTLDPSLITSLLALLGAGGSLDVDVFAACGQVRQ